MKPVYTENVVAVLDEVIREKEQDIKELWRMLNNGVDDAEYDIARYSIDVDVLKYIKSKFVE